MFIYYIVSGLKGEAAQGGGGAEDLICPAVHVRPLRGLSTLLALSPGRSRSWWLASRRPRARSTTWGYSRCDPSGVSARTELSVVCCSSSPTPEGYQAIGSLSPTPERLSGNRQPVSDPGGVSGNRQPVSDPGGVSGNRFPSPTPEGSHLE